MSEENFIPFSSSYHFWGVVKIRQTKPKCLKAIWHVDSTLGKYMAVWVEKQWKVNPPSSQKDWCGLWSPVPPKMGPIYLLIKIIKYHFSVFSFPFLDGPIKIYYKLRAQLPCESGLPQPPLSEVMWLAPLHPHHQMGLCQLANMFLYFVYGLLFFSHFLWLGAFLSRSGKWGVGFVAFFFFLFWDKH